MAMPQRHSLNEQIAGTRNVSFRFGTMLQRAAWSRKRASPYTAGTGSVDVSACMGGEPISSVVLRLCGWYARLSATAVAQIGEQIKA